MVDLTDINCKIKYKNQFSIFNKIKIILNDFRNEYKQNSKFKESKYHTPNFEDIMDVNLAYVLNAFPQLSETFIRSEVKYLMMKDII